jgi:hypothetical protein
MRGSGGAPRRGTRAFLVAFQDVTVLDYPRELLPSEQRSKSTRQIM